ncbi:MAG: GNAT family N-acetyltransferase [Akkermansiaceae bacterium]|nr:GNAT family N-acetyltransferase [Akkermansiaceae bacterium]
MNAPDEQFHDKFGLWWTNSPSLPNEKVGCIGMLAPEDLELLSAAEDRLREAGCTTAIGPIDGNTWSKHRAVIKSEGRPPFMLEPFTPPEIARGFQDMGYSILAQYSSSIIPLDQDEPQYRKIASRMDKAGVGIRQLNLDNVTSELQNIFQLSLKTFTENFLYTPISENEFLAMYQPLTPLLTPESAFIAERDGKPVGFVFGYQQGDTMIVKTLAVLPERILAGLGTLLVHQIQQSAKERGCTSAIHALQRENNQSLRISKRFSATVFRRYALFSKSL